MTAHSNSQVLTAQQSCCSPAALAAYALGAVLWAPALMFVAWLVTGAMAPVLPAMPQPDTAELLAALTPLRFALYIAGALGGWDYGYGINGVIVNRRLTLAEKVNRIARDWFGIVLMTIWLCVIIPVLIGALALQ